MGIRIAHVLGSLGIGGAERVALDLATEQKKNGHSVCVISLSKFENNSLASEFSKAGIDVHRVVKEAGLDWRLPGRIATCLRKLSIEVVHTHNAQPLVYAAAASRLSGHAVIHTRHGEGHLESRGAQFLRRIGAPFVHSYVAVSERTAEQVRAQWAYPFPSRIQVIPNGIRLDIHRPDGEARRGIRDELGIGDDAWVVVTVGRCDDNKNQSSLVRSVDSLLAANVHLIVVGQGNAMGKLQKVAEACSRPGSVHIVGRRGDVPRIMAAADAFALPSLSEGLPLVLLEAMATGLPVVSTAVGGIPGFIENGVTGYLVPPADELAMTSALVRLVEKRDEAAAVGDAGRVLVTANYSSERMASDYLKLYNQALA